MTENPDNPVLVPHPLDSTLTPERLAIETPWSVEHWRNAQALLGAEWPRLIDTVLALTALGVTTPYAAAADLLGALDHPAP